MADRLQRKVKTFMKREVVSVGPEALLKGVFQLMEKKGVGGLPVVDPEGRVLGIVTESDLIQHFTTLQTPRPAPLLGSLIYLEDLREFNQHLREHCAETVEGLMRSPAVTISEEATLQGAIDQMARRHVNRLPVVNSDDKLVGILTRMDIVRQLSQLDLI